jgi:hypothetical protein
VYIGGANLMVRTVINTTIKTNIESKQTIILPIEKSHNFLIGTVYPIDSFIYESFVIVLCKYRKA